VLSEVHCHVAALSECTATAVHQALECSLESVCLRVHHSDGLAHRFGDSLEALFATQILVLVI